MNKLTTVFLLNILLSIFAFGQDVLKGEIVDESFQPIPFADIFVKGESELRTRADVNGKYVMRLIPGDYRLVYTATGYQPREIYFVVKRGENYNNVQLFPLEVQDLEEIEISTKKRNPGRDIILKVVEKKDSIDFNQYQHKCDVYIKANEKVFYKEDKKKDDTLKKERNNFNIVEVKLERNYSPYNKVKEFRNAFQQKGSKRNRLYFTTTAKSNFNFFKNTLFLDDLNASPIPSPISTIGILSYKYRLVEQIEIDGVKTHKIEIKARFSSTSTLSGFIWVQDKTWMVEKMQLSLEKGNLHIYDYFTIEQSFDISSDTLCVLKDQVMTYGVEFSDSKHICKTIANYSNYDFSVQYPPKYFGNEVAITTKEAYEKDSSYWNNSRTEPLTKEEIAFIKKRDSIEAILNSKVYLDSVDSVYNRVTALKVLWFGVDHRVRKKKYQWTLSSVAAFIEPIYIAGPRVGPSFSFFKKWDNERTLTSWSNVNMGILNKDIKGEGSLSYLYNPFRFSRIGVYFDHDFDLIRSYDAFTQILLRDNFIETTTLGINHSFEVLNGLYFRSDLEYTERRSLAKNTKFITWLDEALGNTDPPEFKTYQALLGKFTLSYTPFQKYMREPYRKVVLGSKWPTFYAYWEAGIPKIFGSDVNHNYLRLGMRQTFKILTFGSTTYHLTSGKFTSAKVLREVDYKYHRRSDPIWFSNPLFSYQDLDTSLPTMDWYFESHFIHHFNGALINKIPFMKRTRITTVAGGGYLFVPEHNWHHYEMYAGIERVFKFSRRRLRIGLYGVFSDGNQINSRTTYKISFALLDPRDMTFWF